MKYVKWAIFIGGGSLVLFVLYRWYRCNQKGEEGGGAFSCPLFSSQPKLILPLREYTTMRQGKCWEITDYGNNMSYRQVSLEECGEEAPVMRQESLAEFQMVDETYN